MRFTPSCWLTHEKKPSPFVVSFTHMDVCTMYMYRNTIIAIAMQTTPSTHHSWKWKKGILLRLFEFENFSYLKKHPSRFVLFYTKLENFARLYEVSTICMQSIHLVELPFIYARWIMLFYIYAYDIHACVICVMTLSKNRVSSFSILRCITERQCSNDNIVNNPIQHICSMYIAIFIAMNYCVSLLTVTSNNHCDFHVVTSLLCKQFKQLNACLLHGLQALTFPNCIRSKIIKVHPDLVVFSYTWIEMVFLVLRNHNHSQICYSNSIYYIHKKS